MAKRNLRNLNFPEEFPIYPAPLRPVRDFEHHGDHAGTRNTVADMTDLTGKELQESYRNGLPRKAGSYTEKVVKR